MPALPRQPLLRVIGRPDVKRGQRVDGTTVGDREMRRHLGPGSDAYAVRLRKLAVAQQGVGRRLAVAPDALLERTGQLGTVRFAHQVGALMVKRWIQKEPVVLELEVLAGLADAALAKRHKLLAFGESPHSHGPFFESNRHVFRGGRWRGFTKQSPRAHRIQAAQRGYRILRQNL